MEVTRVTTDEVKERMERGEQFVFLDTRNPQAWGERRRSCQVQSASRRMRSNSTSEGGHGQTVQLLRQAGAVE